MGKIPRFVWEYFFSIFFLTLKSKFIVLKDFKDLDKGLNLP